MLEPPLGRKIVHGQRPVFTQHLGDVGRPHDRAKPQLLDRFEQLAVVHEAEGDVRLVNLLAGNEAFEGAAKNVRQQEEARARIDQGGKQAAPILDILQRAAEMDDVGGIAVMLPRLRQRFVEVEAGLAIVEVPAAGADRRRIDDAIVQFPGLPQRRREAEKGGADAAAEIEDAENPIAGRHRGHRRKQIDRDHRVPGRRPRVLQPLGQDVDPFGPVEAGPAARHAGEVAVYSVPNCDGVGHGRAPSTKIS